MKAEEYTGPLTARKHRFMKRLLLRMTLAVLWSVFLFICACTYNFDRMITYGQVQFFVNPYPNWHQLWLPFPSHFSDSFILQKIGHFSGFFILSLILSWRTRSRAGVYAAIGYAIATEILQLFFFRDGRISDLFIDSAGILLACWLCSIMLLRSKS